MSALLALGLPALAFQPDATVLQGVEPDRVVRTHLEVQHRLRSASDWQGFRSAEGQGWQAVFDERTGLPRSAWGPPIPLGQLADGADVDAAVRAFLARNPALLGVPVDQLALRALSYDAAADAWTVELAQVVAGVPAPTGREPALGGEIDLSLDLSLDPLQRGGALAEESRFAFSPSLSASGAAVWRGGALLRVVRGRLVWFSARTHPEVADLQAQASLSAGTAMELAVAEGPEPLAAHAPLGARLVVLPTERWGLSASAPVGGTGTGLDYRLAWEVRTETMTPRGRWVSFVDAKTGELLWVYNEVRYVAGTLLGSHDLRTVNGEYASSPLPRLELVGDAGDSTSTADDGSYDLAASSSATASLEGSRVRVVNQAGAEAEVSFSGDFTWTDADAHQAEIDTYVFLHQVLEWRDVYAPEVSTGGRLTSNVNLNSTCNAYFDGSVNFYQEGGGCNNTGRIADVNHHEWGHGFHYYSLTAGAFDGSMSEGIGDVTAFLQSGDNILAPYFMTNGSGIRDVAPNRVYPDDVVGEVHTDGLIYAGAIWDLWAELATRHDAQEAYDRTVSVFANGIKTGPTLAEAYDAAVLGDDDNGDLSDGTPNQCAILEAFDLHGLGPGGSSSLLTFSHDPLGNQLAGTAEYAVQAELLNLAPECLDFELDRAEVVYSVDGGETWQRAALGVDGEGVAGAIPAQPAGTVVSYYLEGEAADGTALALPAGAFVNPFTFVVGDLVPLWCEDFEEDEGGFTHALLDGEDELGADDWIWGTPRGMGGDPDFAYSGDHVWGNDLGGGNYNGEYQDDKHNRLSSPDLDVAGYGQVVLQYRRWLQVEDGYYDHAQIVLEGDDDEAVDDDLVLWANYASPGGSNDDHDVHHQDEQWTLHSVVIDLEGQDAVRLGWEIVSDGGLTFGGWNLDDVCLYAVTDAPGGEGGTGDGGASDGGSAGDGGTAAGEGEEEWEVRGRGCGCASGGGRTGPGALLASLGALGLLLARRRR
ncbi:hypothetical protein L6R53_15965 [Myxococcota bacterium]|nr:hypothetical protein [Myxococcota bacterium]